MHEPKAAAIDANAELGARARPLRGLLSWATLPWLVVFAGGAIRLERFLDNRSLWLDESLLGLNVVEKSFHGLLGSLDYVQGAPTGFLLIEKASVELVGGNEYGLRLVPFLASLCGLVLFALVARRLLPRWPALIALTLFAVNEPLLYQSSEAKPYSSDVTVALLIVWLTCRALDEEPGELGPRQLLVLGAVGAPGVWFSYPSVFVLAGSFLALLARGSREGARRVVAWVAAIGAAGVVSFLALYAVTSRNITTVSASVFGGDEHSTTKVAHLARSGWIALVDPGGFLVSMRSVALLCLVFGVFAVAARDGLDASALLLAPGFFAVAAAALDRYPFGGRFSLFLVSFLLILIARGLHELVTTSRRPWLLGIPVVMLVVAPPVGRALDRVPNPPTPEHVKPLLQLLVREWRPGDTLYVYPNAQYALRYYAECRDCDVPRLPFPVRPAPAGADNNGLPAALASSAPSVVVATKGRSTSEDLKALDVLKGRSRVWLLFSHVAGAPGASDETVFVDYLDTIGRRIESHTETGASLYLYDLR